MHVLVVLVILSVAAGVTPSEQTTCQHLIHCPCGSTRKNVTFCTQEKRKDDFCNIWSKCKTCQDGVDRCLECPEGLEGPHCTKATRREMLYRQKQQFPSRTVFDLVHPKRSNRQSPNQANTSPVEREGAWERITYSYCENPKPILNGKVETLKERRRPRPPDPDVENEGNVEYPQGTRLRYSCDNGYSLEGTSSLICEASGQWSADPPSCITSIVRNIMYCINPAPILNGRIQYYFPSFRGRTGLTELENAPEVPEGTRLEFDCDDGYIAEGAFSITCQSSGIWTKLPPMCVSDCGRRVMGVTSKMLFGNRTMLGEWPWVVAIAVRKNNFTDQVICGGAILNTQTIITAAHCITLHKQFTLYYGKHFRDNRLDDQQVLVRTSDRLIINPEFRSETLDSDIALIKFSPKITFSERIQPICLPTGQSTARNIVAGRKGYVTGWGQTERGFPPPEMKMVNLPVVSKDVCLESLGAIIPTLSELLTQNKFCAGFADARPSTCIGDGGSPIVFYDAVAERYILEGLVSFSVHGQFPGRYTIFTKVNPFLPWIFSNM